VWDGPEKRQVGASERGLEFLRAAYQSLVVGKIDAESLIFVDERGSNTSLVSVHAWEPRGERARMHAVLRTTQPPQEHNALLASITSEGMGSCVAVMGNTTDAVFEAYRVEWALARALRSGQQVVVLDNLGAHKKGVRVRELIKMRVQAVVLDALLTGPQADR
jgi:hypothetical protein